MLFSGLYYDTSRSVRHASGGFDSAVGIFIGSVFQIALEYVRTCLAQGWDVSLTDTFVMECVEAVCLLSDGESYRLTEELSQALSAGAVLEPA